jgi:hypothetical protein
MVGAEHAPAAEDRGRTWRVSTGLVSYQLRVDEETVALLDRAGAVWRSWPLIQLVSARTGTVRFGFPPRPGLTMVFNTGDHQETCRLAFPVWFGLWGSTEQARQAKEWLDRRR